MKSLLAFALSSLVVIAYAAPAKLGLDFDKRDDLPLLKLPYATYRAASYDSNGDVGPLLASDRATFFT